MTDRQISFGQLRLSMHLHVESIRHFIILEKNEVCLFVLHRRFNWPWHIADALPSSLALVSRNRISNWNEMALVSHRAECRCFSPRRHSPLTLLLEYVKFFLQSIATLDNTEVHLRWTLEREREIIGYSLDASAVLLSPVDQRGRNTCCCSLFSLVRDWAHHRRSANQNRFRRYYSSSSSCYYWNSTDYRRAAWPNCSLTAAGCYFQVWDSCVNEFWRLWLNQCARWRWGMKNNKQLTNKKNREWQCQHSQTPSTRTGREWNENEE